jgi:outer membrane cobalamin receptor
VRLAGFDLISVRANQKISDKWSIYARVENANDVSYQTAADYGSTPRQAFVGLRATF